MFTIEVLNGWYVHRNFKYSFNFQVTNNISDAKRFTRKSDAENRLEDIIVRGFNFPHKDGNFYLTFRRDKAYCLQLDFLNNDALKYRTSKLLRTDDFKVIEII